MTLLLLLLLGRGSGRHSRDEDWSWAWALLLVPLVVTVCAPWLAWRAMRDLGHRQWAAVLAGMIVAVAAVWAGLTAWWGIPTVLFVSGLLSLLGISHAGKAEVKRGEREMAEEDEAWRREYT